MTAANYADWVQGIHRKASQLRILFLQLGSSNEPARRALIASSANVQTVHDYLLTGVTSDTDGPLVIDRLEALRHPVAASKMGALRERVFRDVDAGHSVVLVSRAPRIAFPPVVGSALIDDAGLAHAPTLKYPGAAYWPVCVEDGVSADEALYQALTEIGTDLCASLDRVVYENLLTEEDALGAFSARELEAFDGSSLTAHDGATRAWNFPKYLLPLKKALDNVLADALDPQEQLADVSAGLWKIERIIRQAVRRRAITAWGETWRTQCLNGDLPSKVLERATESAYLGAVSLKQVRDPLEWLSLGELLQLKDRIEIGDLGLTPVHWKQFGAQVMPIRNRLAHMRSLRPEDAVEVTKWRRVLELRVSSS
ncbi:hypothetical protein [Microbacterium sp. A93]|uniref:hypothetical protein n=1 Tax=Microbacterium sp. A93 TaxID=3450716 RepID=UPI003F424394